MSTLRIESLTLPAANAGPENPLPVLSKGGDLHASIKVDDSVPPEDRQHLGWGQPAGLLPYRLLDGYDRARAPRDFTTVVLENEILRAVFMPELGGRLWSLVHKATGRELLARNRVFQPCNLAIRNAWISGGVEWNFGWTGHWPYTCSPLFAARHELPDGTPALRMWEWERVREMPFQIDAWLPEGSPVLLVRVSIRNPHSEEKPVYWWSNIAAEQHADTRVLASADDALIYSYGSNALTRITMPLDGAEDVTYPGRQRHSRDFFFRVPRQTRPWIAAIDEEGRGLFQTSTARLRGRKLFRWGIQTGGENWQRFLGTPDYIEIQAGLARTQSHHLPMPPKTTWSWVEAYGLVQADAAAVHGADWRHARESTAHAIEQVIADEQLEAALGDSAQWADHPARDIIQQGSGWAALEAARRLVDHEPSFDLDGLHFPLSSITDDQAPWSHLLKSGILPERDPLADPGCFVSHTHWLHRLEKSLQLPGGRHWTSLFHLGVLYWSARRMDEAVRAWRQSCQATENPWSRRCLGTAALFDKRHADAIPHLRHALEMKPELRPLLVEYLSALLADKQFETVIKTIDALPAHQHNDGRIRLFEGRAMMALNDLAGVERILAAAPIAVDMREGESGFSDLWFELKARRLAESQGQSMTDDHRAAVRRTLSLPATIDYRMGG
jgi:hypothetical protein